MVLLLALLLVLLFFGLGFTAHLLWIVAVVLLVLWLAGWRLAEGSPRDDTTSIGGDEEIGGDPRFPGGDSISYETQQGGGPEGPPPCCGYGAGTQMSD